MVTNSKRLTAAAWREREEASGEELAGSGSSNLRK